MRRRKPDKEEEDKKKKEGAQGGAQEDFDSTLCCVCRQRDEPQNLVNPCYCRSLFWHYECLAQWIRHIQDLPCTICNGTYTDHRIRRENSANRLRFYREDPFNAFAMALCIALIGFISGIIYLILYLNGFNLSNISVIEYFTIALLLFMIYGVGYAINVGERLYTDSARSQDVIRFLDFDGVHEVPAVNGEHTVYEYGVGQDRMSRRLGEQARMEARLEQEHALELAQQNWHNMVHDEDDLGDRPAPILPVIELDDPTDDEDDDELQPFYER